MVASFLVSLDCVYVLSTAYQATDVVPRVLLHLWGWYGESDTQYAASGAGIRDSNGWMTTQSKFNLFELAAQLTVLFVLRANSPQALLTLMVSSVCTAYKTLIYMSIIAHSSDPVYMVPLLACAGMSPLPGNAAAVASALDKDNCAAQLFKFQFNFWWIVCPAAIIRLCWQRISAAFESAGTQAPRGAASRKLQTGTQPGPATPTASPRGAASRKKRA